MTNRDGDMAVSRETFDRMEPKSQMGVIFDYIREIHTAKTRQVECCEDRKRECDERFNKLKKRQKTQLALAAMGGFVGGFAAHWLEWLRK